MKFKTGTGIYTVKNGETISSAYGAVGSEPMRRINLSGDNQMTKPPKTMEEIKNAEAEKYSGVEATDSDVALWSELSKAFKAGFDCRDKLGDDSLWIAVEAIRDHHDVWKGDDGLCYAECSDLCEALVEIQKLRTKT